LIYSNGYSRLEYSDLQLSEVICGHPKLSAVSCGKYIVICSLRQIFRIGIVRYAEGL